MYRSRLWTMRQYAGFGSAEETNERFKLLLERGQKGLSVAFDLPTQLGLDADDPMSEGEVGKVSEMKLVAIDCVADPSYSDAFVNGILESKQWILNKKGEFEEHYDRFEEGLKNLPRNDVNDFLTEKIIAFIRNI